MKKFISIIMTLSLCLSVTVPVSAKQIQSVTTEYTFAENATADTTFTGVATGSGEWSETISNYFSLSGGDLTVEAQNSTRSVFASIDQSKQSDNFTITTDLSVKTESTSKAVYGGIAFGANSSGYYQLYIAGNSSLVLAKQTTLQSASKGDTLSEVSLAEVLDKTGVQSVAIELSAEDGKATVKVNGTALISYENTDFSPDGYFGFISSRNIKMVYKNFKISMKEETVVWEESDYEISNFNASLSGDNAELSWTNPEAGEITAIKVYDDEANEITDFTGTVNKQALAQNLLSISGLDRNVEYGFYLVVSFNDHNPFTTQTKYVTIPYAESDYQITNFVTTPLQDGAKLVWNNPLAGEITNIRITDGNGKEYSNGAVFSAGSENTVTLRGLNKGTTYTFTLTIAFMAHADVTATGSVYVPESDESKYYPKNVLVYEKEGSLGLSWVNPQRSLTAVKILNYETGLPYTVSETVSTAEGAKNVVLIKELSKEKSTKLRIVFEFSDGHDAVEYLAEGKASGIVSDYEQKTSTKVDDWTLFYNVKVAAIPQMPASATIERDENGNSYVKFRANHQSTYDNVYYQLRQTLDDYDITKTYIIRLKVKYTNAKNSVLIAYDNTPLNRYANGMSTKQLNVGTDLTETESTDGWQTLEFIMEPKKPNGADRVSGKNLAIQLINSAEEFCVDEIEMIPLDADGKENGESIITNGSFTVSDNTPSSRAGIKAQECYAKDGSAHLSWTNPDDTQFARTIVYVERDKELFECASLSPTTTEVILNNLPYGDSVKYVLRTVDTADNFSADSEIELTHQLSDCVISDIYYVYENEIIASLPDNVNGTVSAHIDVTNNKLPSFSGSLWVAVYENGVLKSVDSCETKIFETRSGKKTLNTYFNVPQKSGYTIEAFFIDDIVNMKLLADAKILK